MTALKYLLYLKKSSKWIHVTYYMDIEIPVEYVRLGSQVELSALKRAVRGSEKKQFPASHGRRANLPIHLGDKPLKPERLDYRSDDVAKRTETP